ncbi:haloacid dehalogenase-like hydrolase [Candidatus Micrarchaeota archaeon]|nr:haloacid dehalogenase-like hydrolase [Candidatus Micrarchaeota archaeon]
MAKKKWSSRRRVSERARAVVLDMDGILVREDAALAFFQRQGLETEFWRQRDLTNAAFSNRGNRRDVERFRRQVNRINRALFPGAAPEELERHNHLYPGAVMKTLLHQLILQRKNRGNPLHVDELRDIGRTAGLMPGAAKLIAYLKNHPHVRSRIYINTAAYQPIAEEVAARLGIPKSHVFGTPVDVNRDGHVLGMPTEANIMRFKRQPLAAIIRHSRVPRRRMVAVGDSATDLEFLTAVSIPGTGIGHRFDPTTGEKKRVTMPSRQGGIAIAHNPSQDMLERIRRGGPLFGRGMTLSLFLTPIGDQDHPTHPNAVVAAAHRLDRITPIFRAVLKSRDPKKQGKALVKLVEESQARRESEDQPIFAFANREVGPDYESQIGRIRKRARGAVAEKTTRD